MPLRETKILGVSYWRPKTLGQKRQLLFLILKCLAATEYNQSLCQQPLYGTEYSKMNQVKFVEGSLLKIWGAMVCLSIHRPSSWVNNNVGLILKLQLINGNLSIIFFFSKRTSVSLLFVETLRLNINNDFVYYIKTKV